MLYGRFYTVWEFNKIKGVILIKKVNYIIFIIVGLLLISGVACTTQDDALTGKTTPRLDQGTRLAEESTLELKPSLEEEDTLEEQILAEEKESEKEEIEIEEDESVEVLNPIDSTLQLDSTDSNKNTYDEFFTNSVFVGDSVMEGLAQYVRGQRNNGESTLSNAQFLSSIMGIKVSDMMGDTFDENRKYVYKGQGQALDMILQQMGVERVFIMLGMNDLADGFSIDKTIERYQKMISILKETNPDLDIVIMTITPKTATKWLPNYVANKNFGSPLLNEFADRLKTMCEEDGIKVVDVNAAVRGPDGHLPEEYSRDNYVHINNECSAIVVKTMREFARKQLEG